jgi:hypothetical protein|tara:strand:+ start:340 stop:444 length:105 start_codon:yes stop_codon:yes gene_type:complete
MQGQIHPAQPRGIVRGDGGLQSFGTAISARKKPT